MSHSRSLKYKSRFILAFTAVCILYSCSAIRVLEVDSPSADCAGSGQHFCHDTTITTSLWKGRNNKRDLKSLCPNGISRVKVTTKPMDVVLGFLTAGLVVKQRLDWDCSQRSGSSTPPR
jgi:hypothetical protein